MPGTRIAAIAALALWLAPEPAAAQFFWPWSRPAAPPPVQAPPGDKRPRPARPALKTPSPANPAEKPGEAKAGDSKDARAEPEAPPPPYEPQLLRLSEIMGALAFLRPLCGGDDGSDWRRRMQSLIEAEATSTSRKERLAGAYNKGYTEFAQNYRRCTPAAAVLIHRYADEGGKLTRELSARFGG